MSDYTFVPVTINDSDRVLNFLRTYFFADEPLNMSVGLVADGSRCVELEDYCLSSIPDGVSIMALDSQGEIIGVVLNSVIHRDEPKKSQEIKHDKFRKIVNFLTVLGESSDVFGRFPDIDKCMDISILSVSEACRGQGIAKALLERSRMIAKENGLSLIKIDCSSYFSAMAVARLGYSVIFELKYSEHLDDEGKPVFAPPQPHTSAKTLVLRVL